MQPTTHSTPLNAFDLNLLPAEARQTDTDAFKSAVISYYTKLHADKGETALVIFENEEIAVSSWQGVVEPMDYVLELLNMGRFVDAARLLRSITFSQPDNIPAFFNLGIACLEIGDFDDAVVNLEKAVALDPSLSDAWFGIGMGRLKQDDPAGAIEALIQAVETDPENSFAQRNLAGLLNKEGRFDESLSHYLAVIEKLPNDPQVIFGLAQCLEFIEGEGNLERAYALYAKVIKDFPGLRATEFAGEARARIAEKLGIKSE